MSWWSNRMGPAGEPAATLPPDRYRMASAHVKDDAKFIATAVANVVRREERAGLTRESRLLDWWCGAGRLTVGVGDH